jgi:Fic family protein
MHTIFEQIDTLKKHIGEYRPFDEFMLKQIKEYYRIGLTYTSNAIEGNALTETETKIVLEEGITIGGKRLIDHLEALGHSEAYDLLLKHCKEKIITEDLIKMLHHLFYYRIDEKNAGIYRSVKIYLTGSKYTFPPPQELPELIHDLVEELNSLRAKVHPVEFAALVHKKFVFIHPFVDGNGRVARLLMNLVLLQEGYTITIIPPIVRPDYFKALEKAHTNDHDFIDFIAHMVKETQQDYIRLFCS